MRFWVDNAVVREISDDATGGTCYETIEVLSKQDEEFLAAKKRARNQTSMASGVHQASQSEAKESVVPYILGVLTTGPALALKQVHERMQAFESSDFNYSLLLKELKMLLEQLVRDGKLMCVENKYKRATSAR
jgi:hypothetical protein